MKTKGMFIVLTNIKHLKECQTCVNIMFVEWKNKRIPWNISWSGEHRRGGGNCERKSEWFRIHGLWVSETQFSSVQFSSVQLLSCVRLFATPWTAARQASWSMINSRSSLRLTSIESVMPSSHLILLSPFPPAPNPSQHQGLFQWVNPIHEVAKVLEVQLWHHSFQRTPRTDLLSNGLVGSRLGPRHSQESSPTPQLKRINSSALSLLHSPTLTSIHDHRKNHSLD